MANYKNLDIVKEIDRVLDYIQAGADTDAKNLLMEIRDFASESNVLGELDYMQKLEDETFKTKRAK